MTIAIKVENLSKAYQIGQIGTGTLSRDIERWWVTKVMGKEDPFLKLGETNDRTTKSESNIVWSLKDINFEIEQGDAVGIIGRNGAGKSTLLKVLSRVTTPTTGNIKIKGRVASLLEVGTGFHPELTGRENIYLNGSILGMRKREIDRRLDEIVDFSGVERYIDTPVKRFSSGMSVRLAFAVAAHLESEVLIVDEVLAVGDADFQKKCLGKMNRIREGEGRTILFVSHNLTAVRGLCEKGILIDSGIQELCGPIDEAIRAYISVDEACGSSLRVEKFGITLSDFTTVPDHRTVPLGGSLSFGFRVKNATQRRENLKFNLEVKSELNEPVYCIGNEFNNFPLHLDGGEEMNVKIKINEVDLRPGNYKIFAWCTAGDVASLISTLVPQWAFTVEQSDYLDSGGKLPYRYQHGTIVKRYCAKRLDRKQRVYLLEI